MVTGANKEIIPILFLNPRNYLHHYTSLGTKTFQITSQINSKLIIQINHYSVNSKKFNNQYSNTLSS